MRKMESKDYGYIPWVEMTLFAEQVLKFSWTGLMSGSNGLL
jgi:hypothetical protein